MNTTPTPSPAAMEAARELCDFVQGVYGHGPLAGWGGEIATIIDRAFACDSNWKNYKTIADRAAKQGFPCITWSHVNDYILEIEAKLSQERAVRERLVVVGAWLHSRAWAMAKFIKDPGFLLNSDPAELLRDAEEATIAMKQAIADARALGSTP